MKKFLLLFVLIWGASLHSSDVETDNKFRMRHSEHCSTVVTSGSAGSGKTVYTNSLGGGISITGKASKDTHVVEFSVERPEAHFANWISRQGRLLVIAVEKYQNIHRSDLVDAFISNKDINLSHYSEEELTQSYGGFSLFEIGKFFKSNKTVSKLHKSFHCLRRKNDPGDLKKFYSYFGKLFSSDLLYRELAGREAFGEEAGSKKSFFYNNDFESGLLESGFKPHAFLDHLKQLRTEGKMHLAPKEAKPEPYSDRRDTVCADGLYIKNLYGFLGESFKGQFSVEQPKPFKGDKKKRTRAAKSGGKRKAAKSGGERKRSRKVPSSIRGELVVFNKFLGEMVSGFEI